MGFAWNFKDASDLRVAVRKEAFSVQRWVCLEKSQLSRFRYGW